MFKSLPGTSRSKRFVVAAAAVCAALSCFGAGEKQARADVGFEEVVQVAPPAPRVEVIPPRPFANAVWTPGYYNYRTGYGHVWAPGRWQVARPGYVWVQPRWAPMGRTWVLRRGGWWGHRGWY